MQAKPAAVQPAVPTQEQADFYVRHGYLPWRRLFDQHELEELRDEYDRVFREAREADNYRNLSVDDGSSREAKRGHAQQMLQITQVCERSLVYRRLIHDQRILTVVGAFLGPNLMLFHDQALFKPARTGGAVHWHQDNAYWRCRPATLMSCWITLDDADVDNGAMQVIPGSHLTPTWHGPGSSTALVEAAVDPARAVVVPLPAGACMFHHCQTLHYTAPNTTDRQRRAFIVHVMVPGTSRDGAPIRVDYAHPMLCCG